MTLSRKEPINTTFVTTIEPNGNYKQYKEYTHNVTMWDIRVKIVTLETQQFICFVQLHVTLASA